MLLKLFTNIFYKKVCRLIKSSTLAKQTNRMFKEVKHKKKGRCPAYRCPNKVGGEEEAMSEASRAEREGAAP